MKTPTLNWTAKRLADYAFELGLSEKRIYRFRGGPLPKATLVDNINARIEEFRQNADADPGYRGRELPARSHELGILSPVDGRTKMKTVIKLNGMGGELHRVELPDEEATTELIAEYAISLIQSCMSLSVGDTITITEEE